MAVRVQGGTRRGLRRGALVITAVVALVAPLAACSGQSVEGTASPMAGIDADDAGGVEAADGPSGPRDDAPDPDVEVENTDDGEMDKLAAGAVADLYDYWGEQLPKDFDQEFTKLDRLVSYDSGGEPLTLCGASTADYINAFYCNDGQETLVAWDRGALLPDLSEQFSPMAVVGVLAHEMGHAVQDQLGEKSNIDQSTPTILFEQQADCYMGNYMRRVADGDSKYFELNTGEGLNKILATLFYIRDPAGYDGTTEPSAHGLAFDRVYAFQQGFSNDPKRCAEMDMDEINERITEQEPDSADTGEAPLDEKNLGLLQESLDEAFSGNSEKVEVTLADSGSKCDKGKATEPAAYCKDEKSVSFDLEALEKIAQPLPEPGTPVEEGDGIGDFAAFAEIASRYAVGVQDALGAPLDDDKAGLRTACLTGAWTQFSDPRVNEDEANRPELLLSVGDLDEAVAELLQEKSLIAADVNGKQVASGFARVEAFALGYNEGAEKCTEDAEK